METEGGINNLSCFGMCCNKYCFAAQYVNGALEDIAVLGTLQVSLVLHVQLFFCFMIQVG